MFAAIAAGTMLTGPFAQSAKEIRGASLYIEIKNEPPPKLIVDPTLPDLLDKGVVWIQWRVENGTSYPCVRGRRTKRISPGRASARTRGQPASVVGGRE